MVDGRVTQAELARRAGCGEAHVHRVMTGKTPDPRAGTLADLADALGKRWALVAKEED